MPPISIPAVNDIEGNELLFALLPGFLTYTVVHALTNRERSLNSVEAVLHAFGYTLVVHAVWWLLTRWSWIPTPDLVGLPFCAVAVGLVIAKVSNGGTVYRWLQKLGISGQPPWPSIWETAFRTTWMEGSEYVVVHLRDGRRVMGAVRGYSAVQTGGHVAIICAQWLTDDREDEREANNHTLLLVPADEIRFLEFLPGRSENEDNES